MYKTASVGVIRLSDGKHIKPGSPEWSAYGQWITAGNVPVPMDAPAAPAPPSVSEIIEQYRQAIQDFLDTRAAERDYDNIQTAALRAALPNSPFHDEGVAYGEWMDSCWAVGIAVMNSAVANEIPTPTIPQLLAMMPELVLPERT